MSKLSKEQIKKSDANLRKAAREELVKSGLVQFRIEPDRLKQLYELADARKLRMGSMIRDWVMQRLDDERQQEAGLSILSMPVEAGYVRESEVTGLQNSKLRKKNKTSLSDLMKRFRFAQEQQAAAMNDLFVLIASEMVRSESSRQ